MARTYPSVYMSPAAPTTIRWAVAWVRFFLRDKPNEALAFPPGSLDDAELSANLTADALVDAVADGGDDSVYYRPHVTAARLISSNPTWINRWSGGATSEEYRDALEVATSIRKGNSWIDTAINAATGGRVDRRSLTLRS
jgi:hypothetical protein